MNEPNTPDTAGEEPTIEATPTGYRGTTFRSRLEAKWATFLDSHGITWQYEPETITLPSDVIYVPDFWLPELGTWLEVKGDGVPRVGKAIELGESRACHCEGQCVCQRPGGELVIIGRPHKRYDPWRDPRMQGVHYTAMASTARRHGGHPTWSSACGRTTWIGTCTSCGKTGWFVSRSPISCRACHERPAGGHLYASGDPMLDFPREVGIQTRGLPEDPEREALRAQRIAIANSYYDEETW